MQSLRFQSLTLLGLRLALVLSLLAVLPAAVLAATVAIVTDLQGKAAFTEAARFGELTMLANVEAGSRVQLQPNSTLVVLYLESGVQYSFLGPAEVVFPAGQPDVVEGARPLKRLPSAGGSIRIKPVGLSQGGLVMRGPARHERIKLLSASGTRILGGRPDLQWLAPQPGLKYRVEITDQAGRLVHEALVDEASMMLPIGMQLKDGASYLWEVSTGLPDGRKYASTGSFVVADPELREAALTMRANAMESFSSQVVYALWLEQVELNDEAKRLWRALSLKRPGDTMLRAIAER